MARAEFTSPRPLMFFTDELIDGPQIIKEAIQNADDAKARKLKLCLDLRSHGTQSLLVPSLAPYQGPALLIYNDGTFIKTLPIQ